MSEFPYSTISVSGPDAFDFLQNQLTNDLRECHGHTDSDDHVTKAKPFLSAWCNPKGRVIWFGTVQKTDDGYRLSVPADMAEDMVRRLTMFRFRSKVEFAIEPGGTIDPGYLIEKGYPFIGREQSEEYTPHMLNLDLLGAISLEKGCYPGQEIVARTHYKGSTKRRCLRFESAEPVSPGDKVSDGAREVGNVLNAFGNELLAIVPTEKADQPLTVKEISLVKSPLPYLQEK